MGFYIETARFTKHGNKKWDIIDPCLNTGWKFDELIHARDVVKLYINHYSQRSESDIRYYLGFEENYRIKDFNTGKIVK